MKIDRIFELFEKNKTNSLKIKGFCWDCGKKIKIKIKQVNQNVEIIGGALYDPDNDENFIGKCNDCFDKNKELRNYQKCEVYSRVVGYLRPVSQWNPAKQAEFKDRKMFKSEG